MDDNIRLLSTNDTILDLEEEREVYDGENLAANGDRTEDTGCDVNSQLLAPALPASKQYHLFVCYATEDRDRVFPIVTELETVYGAKCLFADRDFQPGKEIRLNIEEGINNSVKILMILSPNFAQSRYCLHESEIAFQRTMETGLNYVIPVLLEECEVPYGLKPKTYIDATLPNMNATAIALRIIMALNQPESSNALLSYEMLSEENKHKNGFSVDIEAHKHRRCWCKSSGYKFHLDDTMHRLKTTHIQVTSRQVNQAITLLNQHPILHWHDLRSCRKVCAIGLCFLPVSWCIVIAIIYVFAASLATGNPQESIENFNATTAKCSLILAPVGFVIILCVCLCICGKRKIKKMKRSATEKLWQQVTSKTYIDGVAFSFMYSAETTPILRVMRYDVKRCRAYIVGCLKRKYNCNDELDLACELQATEVIEHWLKTLCTDPLQYLPDAPTNRHSVVQDKMCICQLYERYGDLYL